MRKLIAIMIALVITVSMSVSASAFTTGKWNFSASQAHVQQTIQKMIKTNYVFDWSNLPN